MALVAEHKYGEKTATYPSPQTPATYECNNNLSQRFQVLALDITIYLFDQTLCHWYCNRYVRACVCAREREILPTHLKYQHQTSALVSVTA
jgi:hypothetical protein